MNPFKRPQPESGPTIYRPSETAAEPHPRQYRTLAVEPAQAPALLPELSLLLGCVAPEVPHELVGS